MSRPQPVDPAAVIAAYMDLYVRGEPKIAEGSTTPLDGKRVRHLDGESGVGVVLGPAAIDGFVWVRYEREGRSAVFGLHRIVELEEVADDERD